MSEMILRVNLKSNGTIHISDKETEVVKSLYPHYRIAFRIGPGDRLILEPEDKSYYIYHLVTR